MRLALCIVVGIAMLATGAVGQVRPATGAEPAKHTIDTYCIGCHNSRAKVGDLAPDAVSLEAVPSHADVWEKATALSSSPRAPRTAQAA